MYPIGLSTCEKPVGEDLFALYQKAGIHAMELCATSAAYTSLPYKSIARWAKQYAVTPWSLHLPFTGEQTDISALDRSAQRAAVALHTEWIKRIAECGVRHFIIHPSEDPFDASEREERLLTAQESLFTLADVATSCGGLLAVENPPNGGLGKSAVEMARLTEIDPRLGICLDTGHLFGEEPVSFIHRLGSKIITLHVADYDRAEGCRLLPGEGRLNWSAIAQALAVNDYRGVWMYALNLDTLPRALTFEELVANAKEIFAFQKMSTPPAKA